MIQKHVEPSCSTFTKFYKLVYFGKLLTEINKKISSCCKYYCKNTDIKISVSLFKVGDLFSIEESIPKLKALSTGCNDSYIGEIVFLLFKVGDLFSIKVRLSPSKKICVVCFIESPLTMMKNAFYFIIKALFVLKIFKFLP